MEKNPLFTILVLLVPSFAIAHGSVRPRESKPGAEERYTARVPTEAAIATTHATCRRVPVGVPQGIRGPCFGRRPRVPPRRSPNSRARAGCASRRSGAMGQRASVLPLRRHPRSRLANHKQLALDGRTLFVVVRERLKRHAIDVAEDGFAGGHHVRDVEEMVTQHARDPAR